MPRRTSEKATLPRVCMSALASELLTATLLPPSLLLLLSPPLSHPHILTPSHPHTLMYTCTMYSVKPQFKSPIQDSYVLPSHFHTPTCTLTPHTLTPSHPHTMIMHSPHIHSPSHPHTCVTPSFIPLPPTPSPPPTLTGTSSSCPASTWAPLGLTSSVWSCSWITSPDSWEGKRWVWPDKRMSPLNGVGTSGAPCLTRVVFLRAIAIRQLPRLLAVDYTQNLQFYGIDQKIPGSSLLEVASSAKLSGGLEQELPSSA